AALAVQLEVLEPGREWRLRALVFRGNHALGTGELRRALVTAERPWYERWRVWRPAPEFDPVTFPADLECLRGFFRSRGDSHERGPGRPRGASAHDDPTMPRAAPRRRPPSSASAARARSTGRWCAAISPSGRASRSRRAWSSERGPTWWPSASSAPSASTRTS